MNKNIFQEKMREYPEESDQIVPIISSLLSDNPEMKSIIQTFVECLPDRVEQIGEFLQASDWLSLEQEAHKMIIAESYGFQDLTSVSVAMERAAQDQYREKVAKELKKMRLLVKCIQLGIDP